MNCHQLLESQLSIHPVHGKHMLIDVSLTCHQLCPLQEGQEPAKALLSLRLQPATSLPACTQLRALCLPMGGYLERVQIW